MLMAAGLGTRLRPFTEAMPKALLPMMGVPMAQFPMDAAVEAGARRIVANVHHLADQARAGLEGLERGGADLVISDESRLLLGSAGGLRHALEHFRGQPFFLLNADVLCEVDLQALARHHEKLRGDRGVLLTLAVFRTGPAPGKYREILLDPRDRSRISGLGEPVSGRPFFVGAAVIEPEAVAHLSDGTPREFVPEILLPAIQSGRAGAFLSEGLWFDVGSPELWLRTHLELMRSLETGFCPESWRRRIESRSRRIAPGIWARTGLPAPLPEQCASPAYWSPAAGRAPALLGPSAVLYGDGGGPDSISLSHGIGFSGMWQACFSQP